MHVDRKTLHLVIPIEREDGGKVFVHVTPVDRAVYDRYFKVIASTYGELTTGPMRGLANKVAMRALRQMAADLGLGDDAAGGLIEEIRRLTNITAPTPAGWQTLPLGQAVAAEIIDEEEADEIENNAAFFTCFWHMTKRGDRRRILDGLANAWGLQISSLDSSEHANSLRTSTEAEPSGPKAPPSSIPR